VIVKPAPAPVLVRAPDPVPIERARIARVSAVSQSPRVMSPPRSGPPRVPERERTSQVQRVERAPARPLRATETRPLPLPAPEDTTRTKAAPPATPPRPAAIAAVAAVAAQAPVHPRFESEITRTDARPALPRFSARFR
jgi:hypothetical protein